MNKVNKLRYEKLRQMGEMVVAERIVGVKYMHRAAVSIQDNKITIAGTYYTEDGDKPFGVFLFPNGDREFRFVKGTKKRDQAEIKKVIAFAADYREDVPEMNYLVGGEV